MKRYSLSYYDLTAFILVSFFCFSEILISIFDVARYMRYILPLFGLIFLLLSFYSNKSISPHKTLFIFFNQHSLLAFFVILISIFFSLYRLSFDLRMFSEFIFIVSPLIFAFVIAILSERLVSSIPVILLFLYLICFLISNFGNFTEFLQSFSNFKSSILTSEMKTESTYCFVFGMLSLYFLIVKKRFFMFSSFILTIISFKRIVIISVVLLGLFYFFVRCKRFFINHKKKIAYVLTIVNLGILFFLLTLFTGHFDTFIADIFGVSSNSLSMGRKSFFSDFSREFGAPSFFGLGLGAIASSGILDVSVSDALLHSDILKLSYELGIFGFLVWTLCFYRINFKNLQTLILPLLINLLFITDNIFIYFHVMFPFYLLQANLILRNSHNNISRDF